MPCACLDNPSTVDRVAHLLDAVKRIGIDDLERIVQQAHECDIHQITEPMEKPGGGRCLDQVDGRPISPRGIGHRIVPRPHESPSLTKTDTEASGA